MNVERALEPSYLRDQYDTTDKLDIRIAAHQLYSEGADDFLDWILERLTPSRGDLLLDVGCGRGSYHPALVERYGVRGIQNWSRFHQPPCGGHAGARVGGDRRGDRAPPRATSSRAAYGVAIGEQGLGRLPGLHVGKYTACLHGGNVTTGHRDRLIDADAGLAEKRSTTTMPLCREETSKSTLGGRLLDHHRRRLLCTD